jgi:hypothetical protein
MIKSYEKIYINWCLKPHGKLINNTKRFKGTFGSRIFKGRL